MSDTQTIHQAYLDGSRTVDEINAITGLPRKSISKITYKLAKRGLIERTGNALGQQGVAGNGMPGFYEPVMEKVAA